RTLCRVERCVISGWPRFLCCFQGVLEFRLGFSLVAAAQLDAPFSVLPELCRRFRRSPCWRCLFRCHFLVSASGPRSRRFFSTVSCRLFAIPRPVYRTFHAHYASRRSRSD